MPTPRIPLHREISTVCPSGGFRPRGAAELVTIGGFGEGESKLDPACCAIIGARSIDRLEKEVVKDIGVRVFTMDQIDRRGIYDVTEEALQIASRGTDGIHMSFDVDGMDPSIAPGVGTAVPGGVSYRETPHDDGDDCRDRPHGLDGGRGGESNTGCPKQNRRSCGGDARLGLRTPNSLTGLGH